MVGQADLFVDIQGCQLLPQGPDRIVARLRNLFCVRDLSSNFRYLSTPANDLLGIQFASRVEYNPEVYKISGLGCNICRKHQPHIILIVEDLCIMLGN